MEKSKEVLLLSQLIQYLQNDLTIDDRYDHREAITNMIIAVTRRVNNIRYCSKKKCACTPENDIKVIYENNKEAFTYTRGALFPIPFQTIEKIIEEYDLL